MSIFSQTLCFINNLNETIRIHTKIDPSTDSDIAEERLSGYKVVSNAVMSGFNYVVNGMCEMLSPSNNTDHFQTHTRFFQYCGSVGPSACIKRVDEFDNTTVSYDDWGNPNRVLITSGLSQQYQESVPFQQLYNTSSFLYTMGCLAAFVCFVAACGYAVKKIRERNCCVLPFNCFDKSEVHTAHASYNSMDR